MKAKLTIPAVAIAAATLAFAGCGGNDSSGSSGSSGSSQPASTDTTATTETQTDAQGGASSGGKGEELKVDADPSALKFDKSSLDAKAGNVTLVMDNPSSLPHAVAIEGNGIDKDGQTVMKGGTSTVTADLKAGKYTFYCPVDGHKQAGMEGTLTVK
jgi:plastocyanin